MSMGNAKPKGPGFGSSQHTSMGFGSQGPLGIAYRLVVAMNAATEDASTLLNIVFLKCIDILQFFNLEDSPTGQPSFSFQTSYKVRLRNFVFGVSISLPIGLVFHL